MGTPNGEYISVDKGVDRALSCTFSGGDGEHVRTTARAVSEKKNIGVTPGRDRQRLNIVHAYRNARSRREGDRDDRPTNH